MASATESGITGSFTTLLVEDASWMSSGGLEASDWSGSGWGSSGALGGDAGGDTRGLGLRRGEREGLRLRSFLGGERLLGDGERDFLLLGLLD